MGVMARFWPLRPRSLHAGSCARERVMMSVSWRAVIQTSFCAFAGRSFNKSRFPGESAFMAYTRTNRG
ncbi:hypothetical protein FEI14_10280 [Lacticaseibacillus zeae]|uniref:Uncharacterized protein n=1 Tax=Lacticaseibacillus zeae TaxID=57037 RepID=A0A5R8LUA0_LACZE|nr:hypothetical protein FEI14_10280 [Lacticaseibacillus zeae]